MESTSEQKREESTEQLLEELREVVEDGEALLRAGANELNGGGSVLREKLSAALDRAKGTARRLQEQAAAKARAADRTVRDNPYQVIGVAFLGGIIVGALLNRK